MSAGRVDQRLLQTVHVEPVLCLIDPPRDHVRPLPQERAEGYLQSGTDHGGNRLTLLQAEDACFFARAFSFWGSRGRSVASGRHFAPPARLGKVMEEPGNMAARPGGKKRLSELAEREYFACRDAIQRLDDTSFKMKAWSVTLAMAGGGAALLNDAPHLLPVALLGCLIFWWMDALWKTVQFIYMNRSGHLERYFEWGEFSLDESGNELPQCSPQLTSYFRRAFGPQADRTKKRAREVWRAARYASVAFPHWLLCLALLSLWVTW